MPAAFLMLGHGWINLDKVTAVDVKTAPNGEPIYVVWFAGGSSREVSGDEGKRLLEYLGKHRAE